MTSRSRALFLFAALALGMADIRVAAEGQKFDALIGTWVLNMAKSTVSPVPKVQIRSFDYTHDGMIMCTLRGESAQGNKSFTHWFTNLDGVQHPEFPRGAKNGPVTSIALRKTGERTAEIKGVTLANGKVHLTGSLSISEDGKTMTWTTKNVNLNTGAENNQIRIYEKE